MTSETILTVRTATLLDGIEDPIVSEALAFCIYAHKGQKRKYTGEPYASHPIAVANMVAQYCDIAREEPSTKIKMICAALLHDVLEDCPQVDAEELEAKFGRSIKDYVYWLSAPSKGLSAGPGGYSREHRKQVDHAFLACAPGEVLVIKACDILHNSESIMLNDKGFGPVYIREVTDLYLRISAKIKYDAVDRAYHRMLEKYKHLISPSEQKKTGE